MGCREVKRARAQIKTYFVVRLRLVGIDPRAYFRDVLLRVATHPRSRIAELTPKEWAEHVLTQAA